MQVLTADEIKQLEQETFFKQGLPSLLVMENAGRAVAEVVLRQFHDGFTKEILIICGSGNNGGDGFVAARTLHNLGHSVTVFCTKQIERLSNDARFQAKAFKNVGGVVYFIPEYPDWDNLLADRISQSDLIIDALLGLGFKKTHDVSDVALVMEMMNAAECPIIAVDMASGIDATTGEVGISVVNASSTVTFQYPKLGQLLSPAMYYTGKLYVCDVGLVAVSNKNQVQRELLSIDFIWNKLDALRSKIKILREDEAGENSKLFAEVSVAIIGEDSIDTAGEFGNNFNISIRIITDIIKGCGGKAVVADGVSLHKGEDVFGFLDKVSTVLLSAGILKRNNFKELLSHIFINVNKLKLPVIIDGEVLTVVTRDAALRSMLPESSVLMPSGDAMANLLDVRGESTEISRFECVSILSRALNAVVILRGARNIIADSKGFVGLSHIDIDVQDMALLEDVLSGVLSVLTALGLGLTDAACISVYLQSMLSKHFRGNLDAFDRISNFDTASLVNEFMVRMLQEYPGGKELIQLVNP